MLSSTPAPKNLAGASHPSKLKVVSSAKRNRGGRKTNAIPKLILCFLAIATLFLVFYLLAGEKNSPVVINEEGEEMLSPERQAKLEKELEEIDKAQQYVLIAAERRYYPCFSCPDGQKIIFLNIGEVWRYGVTRKGKEGRYPNQNFGADDLIFLTQFQGTYSECLKMEKTKIYNYPLLPEAKKRKIRLFRPPGNKNDS